MVKAKLLRSVRGHGGGYMLTRDASEIKTGDILRAAEGRVVPISCAALSGDGCPREERCSTVEFWSGLDKVIEQYVDNITLADLLK